MMTKRRKFSPEFKARVVLELISGEKGLMQASRESSVAKIDDVMEIMLKIKSAWDQISVADREKGFALLAEKHGTGCVPPPGLLGDVGSMGLGFIKSSFFM